MAMVNDSNNLVRLKESLKERLEFWTDEVRDDDVMDFSTYDLADAIHEQPSFKLYRYSPASYYNIRNLEKQQIHLSPNGVFNDLYEGLPRSSSEIISLSDIRALGDLAYITCMTESNANTLMWSHYADSNRGICVEYDLKQLSKPLFDITAHLFPVIYMSERLQFKNLSSLAASHMELKSDISQDAVYSGEEPLDDILPLFISKGMCWQYEQEWRIIYTLKQMYDIDNLALYNGIIPFPCVSGVYIGYRVDSEVRENIIEICQRLTEKEGRKIPVYQAKLSDHGYDILFEQIS